MMKYLFVFLPFFIFSQKNINPGYWHQQADYQMSIDMDVKNFNYNGKQTITYFNNSPDTLKKVFYHLYFNAFQPGSEMDIRLKTIADPDKRMVKTSKFGDKETKKSRISDLTPEQIGFMKIFNFKQDGLTANTKVESTILEVTLPKPILPNTSTIFTLDFQGQVPEQIRRSGRNTEENVALSMTQWYPKICNFDFEGWHADPYIGREFHGVWGNYDVKITIDKEYTIGGTGYLQNPDEIGHGYQAAGVEVIHSKKTKTLTWHFIAPQVHDFAWAADPEFIHDKIMGENDVELHFIYKKDKEIYDNWKALQPKTQELLTFFNKNIGLYPYKQYTIIQGGDGGMEYAMCTLITGKRSLPSLVGVTAHELAHSWFQHVLATNESKHEWMDEGFTTFISEYAMYDIMRNRNYQNLFDAFRSSYTGYNRMVASGKEQPQTTHADRYDLNSVYGTSSYSKGLIFLTQLGYIIGWDNMMKTLKRYYADYKFTHPTPNDFKRTAERVSGAVLDWYLVDWTQTTNTINYAIKSVEENINQTEITLERKGRTPMPIEVLITYQDNSQEQIYIPNPLMRWHKDNPNPNLKWTVLSGWGWAYPTYNFKIDKPKKDIKKIEIDASGYMADVNRDDNVWE